MYIFVNVTLEKVTQNAKINIFNQIVYLASLYTKLRDAALFFY